MGGAAEDVGAEAGGPELQPAEQQEACDIGHKATTTIIPVGHKMRGTCHLLHLEHLF